MFGTDCSITLAYQGESSINNVPLQEAERLLHLSFLRPILDAGGFVRDGPQERKWFPKPENPLYNVSTVSDNRNELALDVVGGYKIAIHLRKEVLEEGEARIFPVLQIATQSRLEIHDNCLTLVNRVRRKGVDVEGKFLGRRAYVLYGDRKSITIKEIDRTTSEKTMINDLKTSVGEYISSKYKNIDNVLESPCTFKRRVGSDEYYLPQFLRMTAKSSDAPANYGKALELMSKAPMFRMKEIMEVCQFISNVVKSNDYFKDKVHFQERPQIVNMVHISDPLFSVQDKRKGGLTSFEPNQLPQAWGRYAGGPIREKTGGGAVPLTNWKIVHFTGDMESKDALESHIITYRKIRNLERTNLICRPKISEMQIANVSEEGHYSSVVDPGDQLLLVILPQRAASQVKVFFTRAVHYSVHENPPQLQFILANNCYNKSAALGAFSNALAKIGNEMYRIREPQPKAFGALVDAWVLGVDVAHNGQNKPSIACMALILEPLSGSARSWRPFTVPSIAQQEVISGRMADGLMRALLEDVMKHDLLPRARDQNKTVTSLLPSCIVIIRDGLADDQINEAIYEEFSGIDSALMKFAQSHKIDWRPKLVILVSPKTGMDDYCTIDSNTNEPRNPGVPTKPIVLFQRKMMHISWLDFHIIGNPKDSKAKSRRYLLIRDDLEVSSKMIRFKSLCDYLMALMWGFCMAAPFSKGCSSQAAPVKIAKHYAELMSQSLLSKDVNFDRFSVNKKNRPQIVIKKPLDSVTTDQVVE